ncbi:MAG: chemotaxis protein CheW [Verrucomicrobiota bacterium]
MQKVIVSHQTLRPDLGIQIGQQLFTCPGDAISEVVRITGWTPAPASPSYTLGMIEQNGQIYTVIDIQKIEDSEYSEGPAASATIVDKNYIGLIISHADYHPIVLIGERAISFTYGQNHEWAQVELPAALKKSEGAPDLVYQSAV